MRIGDLARGLLFIVVALPLPGLIAAVLVSSRREFSELPSSTREYATIARHLRRPFKGYGTLDVFVPQFGIVALSHMAAGLLSVYVAEPDRKEEVLGLLDEVCRRARSERTSPAHAPLDDAVALDDHNLFWSHLGLILGATRYVRCEGKVCPAEGEADRLVDRVVRHLRARTLASGVFVAPSYPGSQTWPADQTVTLVALKLYDVTHGTSLHEEPLRGFLEVMRDRRDAKTGLYPSSLSPIEGARTPRGCATSWSVPYLAQLDPGEALDQYVHERDAFGKDVLGVGGFREWPPGHPGTWDIDSGPVVFDVGVAATGLGLGGARIFADDGTYTLIRRAALMFGVPALWPSGGYLTAPLLGEAILFDARTARPWFGKVSPAPPRPCPAPIAPVLMALLDLAAIAGLVRAWVRR